MCGRFWTGIEKRPMSATAYSLTMCWFAVCVPPAPHLANTQACVAFIFHLFCDLLLPFVDLIPFVALPALAQGLFDSLGSPFSWGSWAAGKKRHSCLAM